MIYTLIEKVVMKQTGGEYLPHNLMKIMLALIMLKHMSIFQPYSTSQEHIPAKFKEHKPAIFHKL